MKLFIKIVNLTQVFDGVAQDNNPSSGFAFVRLVGKSKVKTTAMVDVEKAKSAADFVDYAVTDNRLKQMFDKMDELGHPKDQTQTGTYIKLVQADVLKEESDVMVASLLEVRDVAGLIARRAKDFWFENI